jgi:hypothetical protein
MALAETMNAFLDRHKTHTCFGTWNPEDHWQDATGFLLPDVARLPRVILSLKCENRTPGSRSEG